MESGYACFCGNEVDQRDSGESPSMECNHVCFGDHTQPCGGDGWVIVFDSEYRPAPAQLTPVSKRRGGASCGELGGVCKHPTWGTAPSLLSSPGEDVFSN